MKRIMVLVLCVCALWPALLLAQPDPAGGPGNPPPNPPPNQPPRPQIIPFNLRNAVVEATPNGLFVLATGVLARFSPDLEQVATVSLLGPMPVAPDGMHPQEAQKWNREMSMRMALGTMLADGELLYIVYGTTLYRVNQQTLKVDGKVPLEQAEGARPEQNWYQPVVLKRFADTLYVLRQTEVLALDADTLAPRQRAKMPPELAPQFQPIALQPERIGEQRDVRDAPQRVEMTVVGVLTDITVGDRRQLALKDDAGAVYALAGEPLQKLMQQGGAVGRRVRATGMLDTRREMPPGIKGILMLNAFQLLEPQ